MAMTSPVAAGTPAVAVKKPSSEAKSDGVSLIPTPTANPSPSPNPNPNTNPNPNPNPNPTARASRWSDAPPSSDSHFALDPPQKKVKNDFSSLPVKVEVSTGANEASAGLSHLQTASAAMAAPSSGSISEQASFGHTSAHQNAGYQSYGSQYAQGSFAPGSAKGTGALFYKTKLCTKFKIGACTFNERCHFAHGVEDLRKPPPLWETMAAGGSSTPGAPGGSLMRTKTRPCKYFAEGNCPYNERCNFLHGNENPQRFQGPAYGAPGPYSTFSMQQTVPTPAPPQGYSGAPAYPNGGSVSNNMQYANPNQAFATPAQYSNQSTVPPTLPTSYGTQADYSSSGSTVPNATPYGSTLAPSSSINPYPSAPEGTNGASTNFNSWNGSVMPVANPTPTYIQTNQQITNQGYQTASWMPNHAAGAYPKVENSVLTPQYPQQQSQQIQVASSTPYVQGVSQQSGSTMPADAGLYQHTYNAPGYPNQQADYTARYNMAEAWGGQTQ